MDLMQAILERHAVRSYRDEPLSREAVTHLEEVIAQCNAEAGLHFQLIRECPAAFSRLASYGMLKGVRDCVAFVGRQEEGLDEKVGYYGELVALEAQRAGLNSCWIALTYRRKHLGTHIAPDEACPCVLAIGYGTHQGKPHAGKPIEKLCHSDEDPAPDWFIAGVRAAQLAPTAMNRQRFFIELSEKTTHVSSLGGPCTAIDLGIVKRHFEIGAQSVLPSWHWEQMP
ncbi:MAG: nitroreductase family protein [Slackia sp.]|nr:nitroreductase family protein [Slackia sp.]